MPLVNALRGACCRAAPPRWVHWGATSKNIIDTGDDAADQGAATRRARASWTRSRRDRAASPGAIATRVMAGRTHGQHALPVTFGCKCAAWLDELMRQRERLRREPAARAGRRVRRRRRHAGGARPRRAPRRAAPDAAARPRRAPPVPVKTAGDRFAEFFLLLAMLSATLGKIAQNVYNLQVTDVDEVTEFVEGKVGSSAMPHKLNPVASGSVVLLGRLLRARAPLVARLRPLRVGGRPPPGRDGVGVPAGGLPAALGASSRSARACSAAWS